MKLTGLLLAFLAGLTLFATVPMQAQMPKNAADSIDLQFERIIQTSPTYKNKKVILMTKMKGLREQTYRYFNILQKDRHRLKDSLKKSQDELKGVTGKLDSLQSNLNLVKEEKSKVKVLGIPVLKSSLHTTIWVIFGVLVILIIIFGISAKKGRRLAHEARGDLKDTEKEFDDFRQKALDEQQKLGRQLQDERNKNNPGAING